VPRLQGELRDRGAIGAEMQLLPCIALVLDETATRAFLVAESRCPPAWIVKMEWLIASQRAR
jgi:hypothetical protein